MKKALSLLLTFVMLLSLMVGCASEKPTQEPTQAPTEASNESSGKTPEKDSSADRPASWLCDEKQTLTVFTYDGANDTYPPPSNDLPFWQWLEEYTNVHIEWTISPISGYAEVLQTRLASGANMADITNVQNLTNANNAGSNGLFIDMSGKWNENFPNTEAYFSAQGIDYTSMVSTEDGSIYGLGGAVSPTESHLLLMYNTKWMNELNLEVPQTLDEFNEVLRVMKEAGDINGNGKTDEIILTGSNLDHIGSIIGNAFGLERYEAWDAFAAGDDGVVYPEYTCDAQKDYLGYMHSLYTDGYLDPEIFTSDGNRLSEKIAADRVGIFVYYAAFSITYGSMTTAGLEDPMGEHYTLGAPLASDYNGNEGFFIRRDRIGGDPCCISTECKNPDLAMRWLDTLLADPEVLKVRCNGFEGQNCEYDAEGNVTLIEPADGSPWNIIKLGCGQIAMCHIQTQDQLLNSKRQYQWYLDEYDVLRDNYKWKSPSVPPLFAFTAEEQEKIDMTKTDISGYYQEMRDKFIRGDSSLDAEWDKYVQTMQQLGLDTFTEAYQSIYDRTR